MRKINTFSSPPRPATRDLIADATVVKAVSIMIMEAEPEVSAIQLYDDMRDLRGY